MKYKINKRVCPVEKAKGLDNWIRRLIHNPQNLLSPYIKSGMVVMDLGCGPGFFTIEIAKLVGNSGKVIAADLQEGMLERVKRKIQGTALKKNIELHLCEEDKIGCKEKVDFVLAFYMVHEVPSQEKIFAELKSILKPQGRLLIVEPKFHVSKKEFNSMATEIVKTGFNILEKPNIIFSRTLLLSKKEEI